MPFHRVSFWQSSIGEPKKGTNPDGALIDNPQFLHHRQVSNIQLFFDLFFVANLTTFTSKHEINSINKLSSYIGFLGILWFTWCQVTLYDVRFATYSVLERIAHACHFGVMVGFATVGPQFDPKNINWNSFQQLSLILMASRITLLLQYGLTLLFVWKYKKTRLPLSLVMSSLAIAAIAYLGLSFVFSTERTSNAYIVWYIVALFEASSNIAIAGKWQILSFKDSNLVERMTCLTLIVLGEGVIGLTGRIALIENLDFNFSAAAIGSIISSVLIIYLVYQLYFHNVQMEYFGAIRQQLWAFLHFPFHMALVLLMEGINQFVIWRHAVEELSAVFDPINNLPDSANPEQTFNTINQIVSDTLPTFWPAKNETLVIDEILNSLDTLSPAANATGNVTDDKYAEAVNTVLLELFKIVIEDFGFSAPEGHAVSGQGFNDEIDAYYSVFTLIFGYFFVAAGIVLISIAILAWLSMHEEKRTWRHYIGILSNFLIGVGVALLSVMLKTDAAENLGSSPWMLPSLAFVLFIALLLYHVPRSSRSESDEGREPNA